MKRQDKFDVCIIGGGAAGLMAACIASESGKSVALFEKNSSVNQLDSETYFDNAYLGKKLLITGKGRCNLTNNCSREEFLKNIPHNGKFLFAAYSSFCPQDVMEFFEQKGLSLKTERGNRVFPSSDKSLDVLKTLKYVIRCNGCTVINKEIISVEQKDGTVCGVTDCNGKIYSAEKVIVCTGGLSYPVTGSTGDGYKFAERFGHTVTELRPSLVPLVSPDKNCKRLQGLSLRNITLSLIRNSDGKCVYNELGEMMFTHFGITGPLVLSASAHIDGKPSDHTVSIDLKPALDEKKLDARLVSDFSEQSNKEYKNSLSGLLPSKLIPIFVEQSGIEPYKQVNSITKEERKRIVSLLKDFRVGISDFRPIDEAVITRGGIKTSEINPSTMESKLVNGLYFAGEVLDVDGYTGGFNLQIAFSTAYLAATKATE